MCYFQCRCLPEFSNVLPMALPVDTVSYAPSPLYLYVYNTHTQATLEYNYSLKKLLLSYACIISAHYLTVFLLLLLIYYKALKHIKTLKREHSKRFTSEFTDSVVCCTGKSQLAGYYEATHLIFMNRHSDASQRVSMYLLIFIVSGFCSKSFTTHNPTDVMPSLRVSDCLLALIIMVHLSGEIADYGDLPLSTNTNHSSGATFNDSLLAVYLIQVPPPPHTHTHTTHTHTHTPIIMHKFLHSHSQ